MKKLAYLSLQATAQGQASYAHVHEIIYGLKERGWSVDLYEPLYARAGSKVGVITRVTEFVRIQALLIPRLSQYDALYVRSHFASVLCSTFAKLTNVPVIQEVNGPYADLFMAWPWTVRMKTAFTWMMRLQLIWADAVIAVTKELEEWIREQAGHRRTSVVPNGANTSLFSPSATSTRTLPGKYVLFFGALAPWQGINTILAATKSPKWPEGVYLVIAGDGLEKPVIEDEAKRNNRIRYMGRLDYREMPGIVAGSICSLSVQNNLYQRSNSGLSPLKVYESLSCGVPVIVSDFSGQADLVRSERCGIVISPDNPHALAESIKYLTDETKVRIEMGVRGRNAVVLRHSWDARARDTDSIVSTVIRSHGSEGRRI